MKRIIIIILGITSLFLSASLSAQTVVQGNRISFQGKLEQGGVPPTGTFQMFFTLWATGWSETQSVQVRKGLYAVELGSVKPIPDSVFANRKNLELEIRVNGQVLEPRVKIYPVPFAYKAQTVEALSIEGKHIQGKTIEAKHLKDGIIGANLLGEGSVNTLHIKDGSIETTDLKAAGFQGIMATDAKGQVTWIDFTSVSRIVFASANLTNPLSQGRIFIGNENGLAREQSIFGDISLSGTGFVTVQNSAINSLKIADGAVQTVDLADNSVLNVKIQDGAVNSQKIQDHTIFPNDIAFSSANMVLATDFSGKPYWEFKTAFAASATTTSILQNGNAFNTAVVIGTNDNFPLVLKVNGQQAGLITSTLSNTFYGLGAGQANTTGIANIFLGRLAGQANTIGDYNVFSGYYTGYSNTTGNGNVFSGGNAGYSNTTGDSNVFSGYSAGYNNTTGGNNVILGLGAGYNFQAVNNSVIVGMGAGATNGTTATGAGNIFLGYGAGGNETGSNKLYIANSNTSTPLLGGTFGLTPTTSFLTINGNLNVSNFATVNSGLQVNLGGNSYVLPENRGTAGLVLQTNGLGFTTWASGGSGWGLTGNAPIATDFIGTINTTPLLFKVNNANFMSAGTNGSLWLSGINNNTIIGRDAGFVNTGADNHFVGFQAGKANLNGFNNHFEGNLAGTSNTTGIANYFSGMWAGKTNTTGGYNHFSGYQAGFTNIAGSNNFAVGTWAGYSNTVSDNHFAGYQAGYFNSTGTPNTFIGKQAGFINAIGSGNVFVGYQAGFWNTASNNHFVGHRAGENNTTGTQNYFSGYQAGLANITGSGNVYIGFRAGEAETGSNKLYIANSNTSTPLLGGTFGLTPTTSFLTINGNLNVSNFATVNSGLQVNLGANSYVLPENRGTAGLVLQTNGLGFTTWATGGSGWGLTGNTLTGTEFIGSISNHDFIFRTNNTERMRITANGNINIPTTTAAGLGIITQNGTRFLHSYGTDNLALGANAGNLTMTGFGGNVFIGNEAGKNVTSGFFNAILGYQAGSALTSGFDNTMIGKQAGFSSQGDANTYIGTGAGKNNNSGINNTLIGFQAGSDNIVGSSNVFLGYEAGRWELGSNKLHIANNSTESLIQGDFLAKTLQINGSLTINPSPNNYTFPTTRGDAGNTLQSNGLGFVTWSASAGSGWGLSGNTLSGGEFIGTLNAQPLVFRTQNTEKMRITAAGSVGIGTNAPNPNYALEAVSNSINGTQIIRNLNNTGFSAIDFYDNTNAHKFAIGYANSGTGFPGPSAVFLHMVGTGTPFIIGENGTEQFRFHNGRLGIGTNNPTEPLHVKGANDTSVGAETTGATNVAQFVLTTPFRKYVVGSNQLQQWYVYDFTAGQTRLLLSNTGAFSVNGSLTINPSPNNYTFPTSRGTAGQVLQTNNDGTTSWVNAGAGSGWGLSGNDITAVPTSFIGTTSAHPLIFKAGNQLSGRIDVTGVANAANTFYGNEAGVSSTGGYNTFMGYQAARTKTSGDNNVILGAMAGYSNTAGSNNVFLGQLAGQTNAGSNNVFLGNEAGRNETTSNKLYIANSNTANPLIWGDFLGAGLLRINGSFNVANAGTDNFTIGTDGNITKIRNIATSFPSVQGAASTVLTNDGAGNLTWAAAGAGDILQGGNAFGAPMSIGTNDAQDLVFKVNGNQSGRITSSNDNTSFGISAGNAISTGIQNTFYGFQAGIFTNSGNHNTFIGMASGYSNTTGAGNTGIGYGALVNNIVSTNNTAVGYQALGVTVGMTGTGANLGIGYRAGYNNTTGTNNTFLGFQADATVSNLSNSTALGNGASVTASNQVRIGNASVTSIGGYANWTNVSDRRLKDHIQDIGVGLDFIRRIRPVQYVMRKGEGKTHYGFIAQELMEVAPHTNLNLFDKVDDFHAIRYDDLIAPSVKAIQELAQKIEVLEKENAQLKSEKTGLRSELDSQKIKNTDLEGKLDSQNAKISDLQKQMNQILQLLAQPEGEKGKK